MRTLVPSTVRGRLTAALAGPGGRYCENVGRCHVSNNVYFTVRREKCSHNAATVDPALTWGWPVHSADTGRPGGRRLLPALL